MSTASSGLVSFSGIESGLNTSSIISAYMAADEGPLNLLQAQQTANNNKISAYQSVEQQLEALQSAAAAASSPTAFASAVAATSTNSAVASATTGAGATAGSTTFSVDQLATANTMVSSGTVSAASDVVASGDLLVGAGGSALGLASMTGSGLTLGSHTIAVTQASAGATVSSPTAPATSTTISAANDGLDVLIDGTAESYTLAAGTYTPTQLAAAVASASGGTLSAQLNSGGQLQLSTVEQGSAATLQVAGGSANSALGLSAGGVVSGTDGIITVDGQANTVTDISATGATSTVLTSGSGGTITATLLAGGLSSGSTTAESVSVGNGSLSSVVAAINSAQSGVTATALAVGQNQYALEVTSNTTGAGQDVAVDPNAFAGSGLGTMTTTTAGQDAVVSLGGPGGYSVSSSSNTFTGLLAGVQISLLAVSAAPVTITVNPNGQAAAAVVGALVTSANQFLASVTADTAYNASTNTAGVLNGDFALSSLAQQVLSVFGQAIGTSALGSSGSAAGLSLDGSTEQIGFNATAFATAYNLNPAGVAAMFTQGGSFAPAGGSGAAPGDVSFVFAGATTEPGAYDVVVDQSAAQATDTGVTPFASGSAAVGTAGTYTISSGGASADYGVAAGASLDDVASGLNAAFASAGLNLSAQAVHSGGLTSLQITSADYGSDQSFAVTSSGADPLGLAGTFGGADVEGTIDGVAATGAGQVLNSPVEDPVLAGLSVLIATPGITSTTDLGQFTYSPGLAGGLGSLATLSTGANGELPATITGLQNTNSSLASQIAVEQQLLAQQQEALTTEFNNLESTLTSLKSESSFLSSVSGTSSSGGVSSADTTT